MRSRAEPVSQVVVSARFAGHAGLRAAGQSARRAAPAAGTRQRAVRQRRRDHRAARSRARGVRPGLFPRQLFGAQARAAIDGQRGRQPQPGRSPGNEDLAALMRRMGRGLFVTEQLGQGVNPVTGDYLARRGGILGRRRRDRLSGGGDHDRRQPEADVPRHRCAGKRRRRRGSRHVGSMLIGTHDRRRRMTVPALQVTLALR